MITHGGIPIGPDIQTDVMTIGCGLIRGITECGMPTIRGGMAAGTIRGGTTAGIRITITIGRWCLITVRTAELQERAITEV